MDRPIGPRDGRTIATKRTEGFRITLRDAGGLRSLLAIPRRPRLSEQAAWVCETTTGFTHASLILDGLDRRPAWLRRILPLKCGTYGDARWSRLLSETGVHPSVGREVDGSPIRTFLRDALGPDGLRAVSHAFPTDHGAVRGICHDDMRRLIGNDAVSVAARQAMALLPALAPQVGTHRLRASAHDAEVGTVTLGFHTLFEVTALGTQAKFAMPGWLGASDWRLPKGESNVSMILAQALLLADGERPVDKVEWEAFCRVVNTSSAAYSGPYADREFVRQRIRYGYGRWRECLAGLEAVGGSAADHRKMVQALNNELLIPLACTDPNGAGPGYRSGDFDVPGAARLAAMALIGTRDSLIEALAVTKSWKEAGFPAFLMRDLFAPSTTGLAAAHARWAPYLVDHGGSLEGFRRTPGFRAFMDALGMSKP